MGNKNSFYHHLSNKRIINENVHQLLNRSGDLLTMDLDKALDFTSKVLWSFESTEFKEERKYQ